MLKASTLLNATLKDTYLRLPLGISLLMLLILQLFQPPVLPPKPRLPLLRLELVSFAVEDFIRNFAVLFETLCAVSVPRQDILLVCLDLTAWNFMKTSWELHERRLLCPAREHCTKSSVVNVPALASVITPRSSTITVSVIGLQINALTDNGNTNSFIYPEVIVTSSIPAYSSKANIQTSTTLGHCFVDFKVKNTKCY